MTNQINATAVGVSDLLPQLASAATRDTMAIDVHGYILTCSTTTSKLVSTLYICT